MPIDYSNTDAIFDELERRGAAFAVVLFSGGNDEGGADEIFLTDAKEEKIAELFESSIQRDWDPEQGCWVDRPVENLEQLKRDCALAEALCAPIYSHYGGFCGDYSVHGTLTWNVAERERSTEGHETQWVDVTPDL